MQFFFGHSRVRLGFLVLLPNLGSRSTMRVVIGAKIVVLYNIISLNYRRFHFLVSRVMESQRKKSTRRSTQHGDHIQLEPGTPATRTRKKGRGAAEAPSESVEEPMVGSVRTTIVGVESSIVGGSFDRTLADPPHSEEDPVLTSHSVSNTMSVSSVDPSGRKDGGGRRNQWLNRRDPCRSK